jgi:hypothetical protein
MKDSFDRLNRLLHYQADAHRTRHMIDAIGLADQFFHQRLVKDRIDDQSKTFLIFEMLNVGITAGRKVVNNRDLVPVLNQPVRKVAADKSGSAVIRIS